MRTKLVLGLLFAVAAFLVAFMPAATGSTSVRPDVIDPQTTNVPYVAWVGEQVRVEKCLYFQNEATDAQVDGLRAALDISLPGKFTVEGWTGTDSVNAGPKWVGATGDAAIAQMKIHPAGICWSAELGSMIPGLATVKLEVDPTVLTAIRDHLGSLTLRIQDMQLLQMQGLRHQFLAVFMQSTAPTITEIATPGDPKADGVFAPTLTSGSLHDYGYGLVKILVKGTFPYGGATVTLPDDWAALAGKLALTSDPSLGGVPGSSPMAWDIHDTMGLGDGVVDPTPTSWDPHSLIGPFDPVRVSAMPLTYLSDGQLTAADAPMPALRVDVKMAAGSVGALETAFKTDIYKDAVEGYYAPYYRAYIPPAWAIDSPIGVSSGVSGALWTNNYPGFLTDGKYTFWSIAGFDSTDPLRGADPVCRDELNQLRPSPHGFDHVAVYTDEHGEAYAKYNPYSGFTFAIDGNNRCDLPAPGSTLGTSSINATSIYPDQPVVDLGNKVSNTLAKSVISMASKTLSCVAKGTNQALCVETILDIKGNPVTDARVRITANSPSRVTVQPDSVKFGGFDTTDQGVEKNTLDEVILHTNTLGQVGVVVVNSQDECVNVDAENLGTKWTADQPGVMRFTTFNAHRGASCTIPAPPAVPTTTTVGGASGGGGGTTTNVVTTTTPAQTVTNTVTTENVVSPSGGTKVVSSKVITAKLVGDAKFVYLKVYGAGNVTVKVKLLGKGGKILKAVNVSVPANKLVKLSGLKVPIGARAVTAGVVR